MLLWAPPLENGWSYGDRGPLPGAEVLQGGVFLETVGEQMENLAFVGAVHIRGISGML